jgi:hypothetical protein
MVKIKIDGKEIGNQFPNMAHALAFAYQNGNCYGAKTLEIAVVVSESKADDSGKKSESIETPWGEMTKEQLIELEAKEQYEINAEGTAEEILAEIFKSGELDKKSELKPIEEMNKIELVSLAKELGVKIRLLDNEKKIISAIKSSDAYKKAKENVKLPDTKLHEEAALAEMTVEELVVILSGYGVAKIDNPTKEQLIEAILKAQEAVPENAENKAE